MAEQDVAVAEAEEVEQEFDAPDAGRPTSCSMPARTASSTRCVIPQRT
jgi:hypothetical protein